MAVKLVFEPGKVVTWEEFSQYPPFSIAVDGYCEGTPHFSEDRLVLNINHHEGVNRQATRSSCDQALVLVKLGLFKTFRTTADRPRAVLYCNDCDQDVVLATYVLKFPQHADRPRLKRLIRIEDLMDMSSGLYPVNRRWHQVRQLAWITEPYDQARRSGRLMDLSAKEMTDLVHAMHRRVTSILFGKVREVNLDTSYEVIHDGGCWKMVREIGAHARIAMVEAGIEAFVSCIGEKDGRYRYSIGRRSQFIPFPLKEVIEALNRAEGLDGEGTDRWGGGDVIGGSPRESHSAMTPEEVIHVVDWAVSRSGRCRCPAHCQPVAT